MTLECVCVCVCEERVRTALVLDRATENKWRCGSVWCWSKVMRPFRLLRLLPGTTFSGAAGVELRSRQAEHGSSYYVLDVLRFKSEKCVKCPCSTSCGSTNKYCALFGSHYGVFNVCVKKKILLHIYTMGIFILIFLIFTFSCFSVWWGQFWEHEQTHNLFM